MATDTDRKDRDVRRAKLIMLLDDLLQRGVVPGAIEVDGMRVEILGVPAPKDLPISNEPLHAVPEAQPQHPTGYRQRAREQLRAARLEREIA